MNQGVRSRSDWVCLMYHEVPSSSAAEVDGYFSVPVDRFRDQMGRLCDLGLRAVSLETLIRSREPNLVALSFDDGHATHYASAYPILADLGFTATFFVTTSWVETPSYVTWSQLEEMAASGMSIQSHTHTHPFLSVLSTDAVKRELDESKRLLDDRLLQNTVSLALPGGDAPRHENAELVAALGYRNVVTSVWGTNPLAALDNEVPAVVRRYTVRQDTTLERFSELALGRSPWWSREGLRLRALHGARRIIGPPRYSRWRKKFLQAVRG
jgi:peptidoglycan/xylan/chitin deacetylase (PgdA/CDA1 family)